MEINNKLTKTRNYSILFSLAVFIVSLTQTALTYNDFKGQASHSSIDLFLFGGFSIFGGGLMEWLVWLANPLYLVGLFFLFRSNKKSIKFSLSATFLGLSFITWKEILVAENGRTAEIESLNLGYWLWVLGLIILSIGTGNYFRQLEEANKITKEEI